MRLTIFAAAITFLLWGTPLFAQDFDGDGVVDALDNCSEKANSTQDDTDADGCGNLCDADYDDSGTVGYPDFGEFLIAFLSDDEEKCHFEPVIPCTVSFNDFGYFLEAFGFPPGPSGTTPGTTACP